MLTTGSAEEPSRAAVTQRDPAICDSFLLMTLPPEHASRPSVQTLRWFFRPIEFFEDARRRYGETFGIRFLGFKTPLYFTSDPAATKAIYSNRANTMPPGRAATLEPVMGTRSILLLDGAEHLARRKLMLPPFHGERMRAYQAVIEDEIRREVDRWPLNRQFSIHPRMQSVTLEVILRAVFGVTDAARQERMRFALGALPVREMGPLAQLPEDPRLR
jgi:cytochrome P450